MSMLPDGSIVPSYLGTDTVGTTGPVNSFGNIALRQGEIQKVIYPSDPKSITGKYVEYSVAVQYQEGNGPVSTVVYPTCIVANLFGGTADKLRYTVRPQAREPGTGKVIGSGSKVLLICVNGDIRRAYIVGGINEDRVPEKESDGHNLYFEFNGVRFTVDKDGQPQMLFRGATKSDGTLADSADSEAEGTTVKVSKDGSLTVATPKDNQFIKLNHSDKTIEVRANKEWNVKVSDKMAFTIGGNINIEGGKTCTLKTVGGVFIDSTGVHVGDAREAWMLGTTYRARQAQMHAQIAGYFEAAKGIIATVAAGMNAVPLLIPAATALQGLGPILGQISSAIKDFESQSDTYISKKNFGD